MPNFRPEGGLGWALGIIQWDLEVQLPDTFGIGRPLGTRQEDGELGEVIRHRGRFRWEEVVGRQLGLVEGGMVGSEPSETT